MIRAVPPVVATLVVQVAALAIALGRASVPQAAVAGVAALLFLLANDRSRPGAGIITGAALTTVAALAGSLLPGDLGWLGAGVPVALVALYVLATVSPFSLPRRRNRESAPDPR